MEELAGEDKSTGYDASNNETNCQGSRREDKLVQRNEERLLGLSRGMHHMDKGGLIKNDWVKGIERLHWRDKRKCNGRTDRSTVRES